MDLRLAPDLAVWVAGYAERRGWTRTQVIEEAIRSFRGDAAGGVPELEEKSVSAVRDAGTRPVALAASAAGGQQPAPSPASPRASDPKPARESFDTGAEWQNAVRLWRARQG